MTGHRAVGLHGCPTASKRTAKTKLRANAVAYAVVPAQRADLLLRCRIPEFDGVVPRARGQCFSIWRPADAFDRVRVPGQRADHLLGLQVPEFDRIVSGSGGQGTLPMWFECPVTGQTITASVS